uniref:Birch protein n=1 Tax=Betula platyphylla TaxID=78630 RepID=A0A9E9L5R4_BETPL|nr:birch protein [Betula platyphylla]
MKTKGNKKASVEEGSIGEVASCYLDLHQVNKPIAAGDRDASHVRREVKLHLLSPIGHLPRNPNWQNIKEARVKIENEKG